MRSSRNIILLFFLAGFFFAKAQNYPVNVTTQLVAPFSGYVPDYASAGEEKLKIILLLTDFTKPHYNVKLKISIQGQGINIQSKSFFFDGPHTLQPGIPFELSGHDLYSLLNAQNLDFSGISRAQYEQKKVLPEGFYTVCITAYDYNNPTPIAVSNNSCTQAWMVLSDPPFLNLPVCGSTVTISNPQQQTFSFAQMNMGSPNSAANTEYVFELWEIRPQGAVPNNIVQTVPPIFTYTTNQTVINYGITEPPLLVGMQYAWRVKAQDVTGRDYFKNSGYSQVCTFTYGNILDNADINLNIHAQPVSHRQIKVWWDSLADFTGYKMEFRKAGSSGNWFPISTPNCHVRVLDLEPQTNYEFHVRGENQTYTSPYSSVTNAATQPLPNYQCGELPAFPVNTNFTPLRQADTGMTWQVGQFEMKVVSLQNKISPTGVYTGYGRLKMPYAGIVYCSFDNITLDIEQNVVQGKVQGLTQGVAAWINENSVGTIQDGTPTTDVHASGPLNPADFHVNTGDGTVTINGTTYTYTPNGLTVEDGGGNLFIVTADGHIINAGTAGNGHGPVPDSKNYITTDKGLVAFNASAKQLYGMDKYKYPSMINYYLTVRNITTGERDPVNWKSVMAQKYDIIDLDYQLSANLKADSILFMTGTGTIYKPQTGSTGKQLYVIGGKHGDVQELFACYRYSKDSIVNIAKLNIVSYKEEKNKVTLVPLGSNVSVDKITLQKHVNDIFKQSVASWEIDIAPAITVGDTLWDKDGNGKLNVGSDIFNRYGSELKSINKFVRAQTYYKKEQYYLIVTDKPTDSLMTGLLGEMPRGRNIGYLFTSSPTATVVAHELAHGAFALEHSFDGNASLVRGTSACLMDYNNGTELYKGKYWDYVHNPTTIVGMLESDDDGAVVADEELRWVSKMLNKVKVACMENKRLVLTSTECQGGHLAEKVYVGGYFYKWLKILVPYRPNPDPSCVPRGNIIKDQAVLYYDSPKGELVDLLTIDGWIQIYGPNGSLSKLKEFLDGTNIKKNLLIFSNGYRPNPPHIHDEHVKEADEVFFTDRFGYWGGIDALFTDKIGTRNVVYADGHASVSTSNHKSEEEFTLNYALWFCAAGKTPPPDVSSLKSAWFSPMLAFVQLACEPWRHNPDYKLHTTPNNDGFQQRRTSGKQCGLDLIIKITNGTIPFDPKTDTIDIVAHSMGHAYALGIIDALAQSSVKLKLGRFYTLAPENPAATSAVFNYSLFEEVWQYGSKGKEEGANAWEQDGIAPQCDLPGLAVAKAKNKYRFGHIFHPESFDPKDYLESHSIVSYFWIFLKKPGDEGYVKKRK